MKLEYKIPKGWRRLRTGAWAIKGDREPYNGLWLPVGRVFVVPPGEIVIRRIKRMAPHLDRIESGEISHRGVVLRRARK